MKKKKMNPQTKAISKTQPTKAKSKQSSKPIYKIFFNPVNYLFLLVFILLLFRLGTYPNYFDSVVEHGIHSAVEKVFDGADVSNEVTWAFTDLHQHGAGRSPLYTGMIATGLSFFGLTLFGVRFFPVLFIFLSLILTFVTLANALSRRFAMLFILFLASSPFFLLFSRSGGIIGVTGAFVLTSLCLLYWLFSIPERKNNRLSTYALPLVTGLSVALLPYCYNISRPLPILLLIMVFILVLFKKLQPVRFLMFLLPMVLIIAIQFTYQENPFAAYFNARGESLLALSKSFPPEQKNSMISQKIGQNAVIQGKYLLGLFDTQNLWNPKIAYSFWFVEMTLYPRFLVPFFLVGFIMHLIGLAKTRKPRYYLPVLFFLVTLVPGLMAGIGSPNAARDYLMVFPLYYFIAYALETLIVKLFPNQLQIKNPKALAIALFIALASIYQTLNFFTRMPAMEWENNAAFSADAFLKDYFVKNPQGKVLFHETPPFGKYSYVNLRWLGGEAFEKKLKSQQIMLLRNENINAISQMLDKHSFDVCISSDPQLLQNLLPQTKGMRLEKYKELSLYYK